MYNYSDYRIAADYIKELNSDQIDSICDKLGYRFNNSRTKELVKRRFTTIYGKIYTQKEVGDIFSISKSRVSQLEHLVLSKIYKMIQEESE